jgi:hypothetical protein
MKNAVFWDVAPCRSCVNRRFGRTYRLHIQGSLQPSAHTGSSLADFSTLKVEATRSSETSVHTRSTRCHIPEDGILHAVIWYYLITTAKGVWLRTEWLCSNCDYGRLEVVDWQIWAAARVQARHVCYLNHWKQKSKFKDENMSNINIKN